MRCVLLWLIEVLDLHGIWNHGCRVMFIVLELKEGVAICNPSTVSLFILVHYVANHICARVYCCVVCECVVTHDY